MQFSTPSPWSAAVAGLVVASQPVIIVAALSFISIVTAVFVLFYLFHFVAYQRPRKSTHSEHIHIYSGCTGGWAAEVRFLHSRRDFIIRPFVNRKSRPLIRAISESPPRELNLVAATGADPLSLCSSSGGPIVRESDCKISVF